jgi:hypothetical protein
VPDPGYRSPLVDFFRRGEVARDVRLLAAQGAFAPRAHEQLALLVLLADDPDREVARATAATLDALPLDLLRAFLARTDVPQEIKTFFAGLGIEPSDSAAVADSVFEDPLVDTLTEIPEEPGPPDPEHTPLSSLTVLERMKLALKGTREQRAQLVRDTNKLVSAAVLSSPKLQEAEVESFVRMGNVSEDTLRTIGHNRAWTKNYNIVLGLCRHPKTPPVISMHLVHRLHERDLKGLSTDRNVQEGVRVLARKFYTKGRTG